MAETGVPILVQSSPPASEPVTLSQVKEHAHVTFSDEDDLFALWITAARTQVERLTSRLCITQTWDLYMDMFPGMFSVPARPFPIGPWQYEPFGMQAWQRHVSIILPYSPVQSVSFIKYVDMNGAQQTLDSSQYQVDTFSVPTRITPSYGNTWPPSRPQMNAVQVEFIGGYGSSGSAVDNRLLICIEQLVRTMHRYRSPEVEQALRMVDSGFWAMIDDLRIRAS